MQLKDGVTVLVLALYAHYTKCCYRITRDAFESGSTGKNDVM